MKMSDPYRKYLANSIQTSNPLQVTIIIHERCLANLHFIQKKMNQMKENGRFDPEIMKEILPVVQNLEQLTNELIMQINIQNNPDLGNKLISLYKWCLKEIASLRYKKQPEICTPIMQVYENIVTAYKEVAKRDGLTS